MSKKIGGIYLFMLFLALSLGACGGGATNDDIRRQQAECASGVAASCDLLNQTGQTGQTGQQTATATPLFTTAPGAITLASDAVTYAIGGGKVPYTATSSDTGVMTTALSGTALTISPVASGAAQVSVVDSAGKSVKIDVTVLPTPLFTTAPSAITLASYGVTYAIGGGKVPYTATSSDTGVMTTALSGTALTISPVASGAAQVSVVDSAGKSVKIDVTVLPTPLFTTAPSAITLAFGRSATYTVGGGKAPYTATSSNTNVETTALSGTALTISSVASGTAQVAIVDSAGKSVTINVTVLGKGQTGTPPSIFPASITAGNCTTNIPFVFTGGTAPFTILSGDIFHVPVSAALRFGSDSYFMASLVDVETPKDVVVTVLDGQSRTTTAIITIPTAGTCPKNELLHIVSGSQNAHVTERITFQIAGSKPPYSTAATSFRSYDANNQLIVNPTTTGSPTVATDIVAVDSVVVDNGDGTYSFNVTAKSTGDPLALNGTVLITVTGEDKQQAHIVFTVFPPPLQP